MRKISTIALFILLFSRVGYAENNATYHDNKINGAYKTAMSFLNEQYKNQLRDAQSLWLKYRDATCYFEDSISKNKHRVEDDISKLEYIECISRLSATRIKELEGYGERISLQEIPGIITASRVVMAPGTSQISNKVTVELIETNSKITLIFPSNTLVKIGDRILVKEVKDPSTKETKYSFIKYL
jgi:uncharacterized protein YecT (DUF1311 family)